MKKLLLVLLFISCSSIEIERRPNIILILTDDQGWGDISINENKSSYYPEIRTYKQEVFSTYKELGLTHIKK
jgi:hypothetical protein|tara:strand:+ start:126 stop:341 length:216 start_codon:yes stop_codon:yes gene_type:complete